MTADADARARRDRPHARRRRSAADRVAEPAALGRSGRAPGQGARLRSRPGLDWRPTTLRAGLVACTGSRGCKFAAADTKGGGARDRRALEGAARARRAGQHPRHRLPNSCAQHYIGDIGLLGARVAGRRRRRGRGLPPRGRRRLRAEARIGRELRRDVRADEVPATVERLLRAYLDAPSAPARPSRPSPAATRSTHAASRPCSGSRTLAPDENHDMRPRGRAAADSRQRALQPGAARLAQRLLRRPALSGGAPVAAATQGPRRCRPQAPTPRPPPMPLADGDDGEAPWHDPAMPMNERMTLAEGRPLRRRLMAAMAPAGLRPVRLHCEAYADAARATAAEARLNLCVPGGTGDAQRMLGGACWPRRRRRPAHAADPLAGRTLRPANGAAPTGRGPRETRPATCLNAADGQRRRRRTTSRSTFPARGLCLPGRRFLRRRSPRTTPRSSTRDHPPAARPRRPSSARNGQTRSLVDALAHRARLARPELMALAGARCAEARRRPARKRLARDG